MIDTQPGIDKSQLRHALDMTQRINRYLKIGVVLPNEPLDPMMPESDRSIEIKNAELSYFDIPEKAVKWVMSGSLPQPGRGS